MSTMQVTPGFGASVATEMKGNAHHQRIIAHDDAMRLTVNPAVSAVAYTAGQCLGGEMTFPSAARFVGDSAWLESIQLVLREDSAVGDIDVVFYQDVLNMVPTNGEALQLLNEEVDNVLCVIRVPAASFVEVGGHKFASAKPSVPTLLQAPAGASSVRAVMVARGAVQPYATDSVVLTATVRRN